MIISETETFYNMWLNVYKVGQVTQKSVFEHKQILQFQITLNVYKQSSGPLFSI